MKDARLDAYRSRPRRRLTLRTDLLFAPPGAKPRQPTFAPYYHQESKSLAGDHQLLTPLPVLQQGCSLLHKNVSRHSPSLRITSTPMEAEDKPSPPERKPSPARSEQNSSLTSSFHQQELQL
ncbi:hypothetical protein AXF42_Ash002339 [Apostasia shenzhenica]|uniref:Uncharacterized protein n=1 Tax=Apostasia shenzhenica TaxID=1088818 RepID=A0A2I0ANG6_9ASPA|nr:hypothetical protein AXF42_Ash002339 [Apostasia shenzhenica]